MRVKKARQKNKKRKRTVTWVVLVGVIGFLIYLYVGGEYGLYQHWKLRQQKKVLIKELEQLKREQDSLQVVIQRLKTDSSYMAKIAREKYNMGYPDEEIIRVVTKKEAP